MTTAFTRLIRRNLQNYFRDGSSVFFSLLSMLILILLMVVFLGDVYSSGIAEAALAVCPFLDPDAASADSASLVRLWTLGSVLSVNVVTVSAMGIGAMVTDEIEQKLQVFYVTPVRRSVLALSYIVSAWLITLVMSAITLAFAEALLAILGDPLLTVRHLLALLGQIAVSALTFSCLAYLLALFIHSQGAWVGVLIVLGTLVGFLSGSYIPVSDMGETIQTGLKCLPFLHGAAMLRTTCMESALEQCFVGAPEALLAGIRETLGTTVVLGDHSFSLPEQLSIFLEYGIVALGLAVLITRKHRAKER